MPRRDEPFDAAVIGGGPAGSAAAIALARSGRRVALIEKTQVHVVPNGEALPPAAALLIGKLGLSDRFKSDGHLPSYANASAWGNPILTVTDFIRDPNGIGWHLDRARFDEMLRDAAVESGTVLMEHATVKTIDRRRLRNWRLGLDICGEWRTTTARWLIDCTGRNALVPRREGVRRIHNDRLVAVVALFAEQRRRRAEGESMTLVESAENGWWYTSPLPGGRRVVAYLSDADLLATSRVRETSLFFALLANTRFVRRRLNRASLICGPHMTSARSGRLEQISGDHWIAAGDACASFDPISAQGIFNALYSGLRAGETVHSDLKGMADAAASYRRSITSIYDRYILNLAETYRIESRWSWMPFWNRRHQMPAV
jgi:flavin-dependent dehydrogenase